MSYVEDGYTENYVDGDTTEEVIANCDLSAVEAQLSSLSEALLLLTNSVSDKFSLIDSSLSDLGSDIASFNGSASNDLDILKSSHTALANSVLVLKNIVSENQVYNANKFDVIGESFNTSLELITSISSNVGSLESGLSTAIDSMSELEDNIRDVVFENLKMALPTADDETLLAFPLGAKVVVPSWDDPCTVVSSQFLPIDEFNYTLVYTVKIEDENGIARFGTFSGRDLQPFFEEKWFTVDEYNAMIANKESEYSTMIESKDAEYSTMVAEKDIELETIVSSKDSLILELQNKLLSLSVVDIPSESTSSESSNSDDVQTEEIVVDPDNPEVVAEYTLFMYYLEFYNIRTTLASVLNDYYEAYNFINLTEYPDEYVEHMLRRYINLPNVPFYKTDPGDAVLWEVINTLRDMQKKVVGYVAQYRTALGETLAGTPVSWIDGSYDDDWSEIDARFA